MSNSYTYVAGEGHISINRSGEHLSATIGDAHIEVIGGKLTAYGFGSVDEVLHELFVLHALNKGCS